MRDENGLEPMDHLFSSPEKQAPVNGNGKVAGKRAADITNTSEEDMDVVDSVFDCKHGYVLGLLTRHQVLYQHKF